MHLFLDTEFTGLHQYTTLISLALVADDGRSFYAELTDFNTTQLTDWHRQHVLPSLFLEQEGIQTTTTHTLAKGSKATITQALRIWLADYERMEVWADVLMYDWVLFCELFGGALHLPSNIYFIPFDFATLLHLQGFDPDTPRSRLAFSNATQQQLFEATLPASVRQHSAWYDAHILRNAYLNLIPAK